MIAPTASSSVPTGFDDHGTWRVRTRRVARAEWIKFRSVRSNVITLIAAGAVLVGFGILFSSLAGGSQNVGPPNQAGSDSLSVAFGGMNLAQLVLGVLGALVVTSEYATGLIRTMFAAVPKRIPVLVAKAAVVALATWAVMTIGSFITFFAAQAVYAGDKATFGVFDPGVLRVVLGVGVYSAGIALLGVALGFLLRGTAATVAVLIGGLMIVPGLVGLLPSSFADPITKVLPSNAGAAFTDLTSSADHLGPAAGLVVFVIWVVGLLVAAGWSLRRRDA